MARPAFAEEDRAMEAAIAQSLQDAVQRAADEDFARSVEASIAASGVKTAKRERKEAK
jgi:hypothetical protein